MASNGFTDRDLYRRVLETWGEEARHGVGECSESIQALTGAYCGREGPSHVAEEIADVEIMSTK